MRTQTKTLHGLRPKYCATAVLVAYRPTLQLAQAALYALMLFALAFSGAANANAFEQYGGKITESDKQSLPPVCRLILFEKPYIHLTGQRENADLFSRPEYRMAKNNIHLHHYCYGQLSKHRVFTSVTRAKRDEFADHFQKELDYVLQNSDKDWPYFDQLYFEQAEMLFYIGKNAEATTKALQALAITPGFAKAHALLSDIYLKIGRRDLALKQLHEGLAANLSAKPLRRRLRELDPKDPLLTQPIPKPPQPSDTTASEDSSAVNTEEVKPAPTDNTPRDQVQDQPTSKPAAAPNPDNPYCRFCP